jgi:hypothetical protein
MKTFLVCRFKWIVKTPEGILVDYEAPALGDSSQFRLEGEFNTREAAIEAYSKCVNSCADEVPKSLILVEEHHIDINWEE